LYRNTQAFGRVALRCGNERRALAELAGACKDDAVIDVLVADTPTGRFRFRVSSPVPRMLLLSEPYYPERRAWVDGVETPIEKANVALSAIPIAAGIHLVELRFVPTSLYVGAALSFATLTLWLVMTARKRVRRTR
jgi:hypothetical protein